MKRIFTLVGLIFLLLPISNAQLMQIAEDTIRITAPIGVSSSAQFNLENTGDTIIIFDITPPGTYFSVVSNNFIYPHSTRAVMFQGDNGLVAGSYEETFYLEIDGIVQDSVHLELEVEDRLPAIYFKEDTVKLTQVVGGGEFEVELQNDDDAVVPVYYKAFVPGAEAVSFTKANYADWTLKANQDSITEGVAITRQDNEALFNAVVEPAFNYGTSPTGTKWVQNHTFNSGMGDYDFFAPALGWNVGSNILNGTMSLYIEEENRYFDVDFTTWASGGTGGGFAYDRTEVAGFIRYTNGSIPEIVYGNNILPLEVFAEEGMNEALLVAFTAAGDTLDTLVVEVTAVLPDISFASDLMEIEFIIGSEPVIEVPLINNEEYDIHGFIRAIMPGEEPVMFSKDDYADWLLKENQDSITPSVALTRQDDQALFNIVAETVYTSDVSPLGTMWSRGRSLVNSKDNYDDLRGALDGNVGSDILAQPLSLWVIPENRFFDVEFKSWTPQGMGGGFSYVRTEVPGWLFTDGDEGEIPGGGQVDINLGLDVEPGDYEAELIVFAADGTALDTITISVTARLPNIQFSNSTLTIDHLIGADPVLDITLQSNEDIGVEGFLVSAVPDAEVVEFMKMDYADWTLPESQDSISTNVILTRQDGDGLFNIKLETNYVDGQSPMGTGWSLGHTLMEYPGRNYTDFKNSMDYNVTDYILEMPLSMYNEEEDKYYDFYFDKWTQGGNGGGFAYSRIEAPVWLGMEEPGGTIINGANDLEGLLRINAEGTYEANLILIIDEYTIDTILITVNASMPDIQFAQSSLDAENIWGVQDMLPIEMVNNETEDIHVEFMAIVPGADYILFEKDNYADWNQTANQDSLNVDVSLTRQNGNGLFNINLESNYINGISPEGTGWSMGNTIMEGDRMYTSFKEALNGDVRYKIFEGPLSVQLIDENRFFDFMFHQWTPNYDGGGFAYSRIEVIDWLKLSPETMVSSGTGNVDFGLNFTHADSTYVTHLIAMVAGVPFDTLVLNVTNNMPDIMFSSETIAVDYIIGNGMFEVPVQNNESVEITGRLVPYLEDGTTFFTKADYADWNLTANQDSITPNLSITRQDQRGIYNITMEGSYNYNSSPVGTIWTVKTGDNPKNETNWDDWRDATWDVGQLRYNIVGNPMWMYIPDEDRYFQMLFTSWTGGNSGGGFSYYRWEYPTWLDGDFDASFSASGTTNVGLMSSSGLGTVETYFVLYVGDVPVDTALVKVTGVLPDLQFTNDVNDLEYIVGSSLDIPVQNNEAVEIDASLRAVIPGAKRHVFIKPDYADWTNPVYQDSVTTDVWLTRQNSQALINWAQESNYDYNLSPRGTEWTPMLTMDSDPGSYTFFREALSYRVGNNVLDGPMSMHLLGTERYFDVSFTDWTSNNNGGGLAYERIEVPAWLKVNDNWFNFAASSAGGVQILAMEGFDTYESELILYADGVAIDTTLVTLTLRHPVVEFAQDVYTGNFTAAGVNQMMNISVSNIENVDLNTHLKFILNGAEFVEFEKPDYEDWMNPMYQDNISDNVVLTRDYERGLFNVVEEDYFMRLVSPRGTKWVQMPTNYSYPSEYRDFMLALDYRIGNNIYNNTMSLMLEDEMRYFDVDFTNWTQDGNGGGFAYNRIEVPGWTKSDPMGYMVNAGGNTDLPIGIYLAGHNAASYEAQVILMVGDNPTDTALIQITATNPELNLPDEININIASGSSVYELLTVSNNDGVELEATDVYVVTGDDNRVHFNRPDGVDWTMAEYQDAITPSVVITRADQQGLFNFAQETSYNSSESPMGTLWSIGRTGDVDENDYSSFRDALYGSVGDILIEERPMLSMYLEEENRFFDVFFHYWANGDYDGEGGFEYTRTEVPAWLRIPGVENHIPPSNDYLLYANSEGLDNGTYTGKFVIDLLPSMSYETIINLNIGAPQIINPLADRIYSAGFGSFDVDISNVFTSPSGENLTLTATSSNTGIATVSVSGTTLTVTEVASGNTTIRVTATDPGNATAFDEFELTIEPGSGIANPLATNLRIYPNPTKGKLFVEAADMGKLSIMVIDLTSRVVMTESTFDETVELDLSGFNKGIYILNVRNDRGNEYQQKIIVD